MSNKVVVFDVQEVQVDGPGGRPMTMRGSKPASSGGLRAIEVDGDQLSASFAGFIQSVRDMLAHVSEQAGAFQVETVEVQAQISAEGKVGFMGTGVATKGSASLKVVLSRRPEDNEQAPSSG